MAMSSPSGRSGRRRGTTQTRETIAAAAQRLFAEVGYDRATFRAIATEAGVDPALVVHFFGTKEGLFREVMALPPGLAEAIESVAHGPREHVGERFARLIVAGLENPATRAIPLGRIRSASQHPEAAALVRETVTRDVGRLTAALQVDRPDVRAVLVGTSIVGLSVARYVVQVEPLASLSADEVVALFAPTFQRYLVGPLGPA